MKVIRWPLTYQRPTEATYSNASKPSATDPFLLASIIISEVDICATIVFSSFLSMSNMEKNDTPIPIF